VTLNSVNKYNFISKNITSIENWSKSLAFLVLGYSHKMLKIGVRLSAENLFAIGFIQMYSPMRFLVNIDEKCFS